MSLLWLQARLMDFDPEGKRLPIKADTASNGKHLPRPLCRARSAAPSR